MKWFKEISNIEELRKQYRKLVVKYHPDNGGSEEIIKEINGEYDILFKRLKDGYEKSEAYQTATDRQKQSYDWEKDKQIREMIMALSKFSGVELELCGTWIYVRGSTYLYKKELKELGLSWNRNRQCWLVHFDDYYHYHKNPVPMSYIREKYGSVIIHSEKKERECIRG